MDETNQAYDPELQLAAQFAELTIEKRKTMAKLEEVKKELAIKEAKLMEILEAQNKESVRYKGIGLITCRKPKVYASIIDGQEEILFESLRAIDRDDLIKTTVNSISLASLVKEMLEQGKEAPAGCSYYLMRNLNYTAE